MGLFLAAQVPIHYLVASPARGDTPWGLVAGFGLITLLALGVTADQMTRKEY
jgi:hypothetical protein